jgi:hypothetical protein
MEESVQHTSDSGVKKRARKPAHVAWASAEYLSLWLVGVLKGYLRIIQREIDIFLGTAMVLVGLLNFHSGKYCDGNTADYLSCTRPNTYYYFTGFDIVLVVLGAFLILIWFLKNRPANNR